MATFFFFLAPTLLVRCLSLWCLKLSSKMMSEGGMAVGEGLGHRSASPPGRESREDWRGGQGRKISPSPMARRSRSRSRSPRASSRERSFRYQKEGTNTISDDPLAQRARLFVGNIEPNRVHRRDLIRLFSRYGDVTGVSVHKGYAFVQMDRERSANKAINYEDNKMFMGSRIRKFTNGVLDDESSHFFTPCFPFSCRCRVLTGCFESWSKM